MSRCKKKNRLLHEIFVGKAKPEPHPLLWRSGLRSQRLTVLKILDRFPLNDYQRHIVKLNSVTAEGGYIGQNAIANGLGRFDLAEV